MNSRERQLAAIRHDIPDRISVDSISVENQTEVAERLHIAPTHVLDTLGIDGRVVGAPYLGGLEPPLDGAAFSEGATPSPGDYGTARASYPLADAMSVAEIESFPWPDAAEY